ncbi:MAG: hypothetical protein JW791_01355 [Nanoarchaeota archaeon]|nr:hypothetical protein [Nanoarchaeota archaeon]
MAKSKKVKKLENRIEATAEKFGKKIEDFAKMHAKKAEKAKGNGALIGGTILITLGLIFLMSELNILNFDPFYITLLLGIVFIAVYFLYNNWAFLIPGIIITGISLLFILRIAGLGYAYPLIVGLSFLAVYATKQDNTKWALIPAIILLAISLMTGFDYYTNVSFFPILLMGLGIFVLYKNYQK